MDERAFLGRSAAREVAALVRERRTRREDGPILTPDDEHRGVQILEGVLDDNLLPASVDGGTETTAVMSVYHGAKDRWGDKGQNITVTNRSAGYFAATGTLIQVVRINGEWRPLCQFSMFIGQTNAAVTAPDSVEVAPYDGGTPTAIGDTAEDISAYNRFGDLDVDSWVAVMGFRWGFEVVQGTCPA